MYLINLKSGKIIESDTERNLRNRVSEYEIGVTVFIQDTIPSRSFPYWKIEAYATLEEQTAYRVVDMLDNEADYYDAMQAWNLKKETEFNGKRYRIEVAQNYLVQSPAYPMLALHSLAEGEISTSTERRVDGMYFVVYLNIIYPEFEALFQDTNFVRFDIEAEKPTLNT